MLNPNSTATEQEYIFFLSGEVSIRSGFVIEVSAEITITDYSEEQAEGQLWSELSREFEEAYRNGHLIVE